MKKTQLAWKSFLNAFGVLIYTSGVSWVLFNGERWFEQTPTFLIPLFMLLLLIVSASITGLLVLGKPIHLYMSGEKHSAFMLLFSTIAWLITFLIIVIIVSTQFIA